MADYNIYYSMIDFLRIPVSSGSSGELQFITSDSDRTVATRNSILANFRNILRDLFNQAKAHIPNMPNRGNLRIHVREIPESSPGVPDFSGLQIHIHEPIVYLVSRSTEENPNNPRDRRPSLTMLHSMRNPIRYQEFPFSLVSQCRNMITGGNPGNIGGRFLAISDVAPVVSEVFSHMSMAYAAENWEEIAANYLARLCYHEICHCKAECENRRTNPRWLPALTHSIHEVPGVAVCAINPGWHTNPSTADLQLMGEHMMCPLMFYKYGQPIDQQCFHHGSGYTLNPN